MRKTLKKEFFQKLPRYTVIRHYKNFISDFRQKNDANSFSILMHANIDTQVYIDPKGRNIQLPLLLPMQISRQLPRQWKNGQKSYPQTRLSLPIGIEKMRSLQ